jgi:23S rRNA (adenine2030-N6)-methyltransferase
MNYRHAFHAGNHADVLKHIVLTRLIALMSRKEQPFAYIDTHAGLGLYDLQGDQASRTGEYPKALPACGIAMTCRPSPPTTWASSSA